MRKLFILLALVCVLGVVQSKPAAALTNEPFFKETFLDMQEDLLTARESNQILMLFFEQEGCPYCKQLHETTLQDPKVRTYMETYFYPVQVDIFGARESVDFDGKTAPEKQFARNHKVMFTPTVVYFNAKGEELFRLSGYWRPFHFLASMRFVKEGHYKSKNFQDLIRELVRQEGGLE
ncbi:thioredoxin family protein [Magnetofaba australis]|uniref:Thioredoxin-like fold domain-containing protein n=1 Tax=Magnetofaba australis IT-1 TaxID=1434232 RepID=A0A1Y2K862_9PROT|nr:thioredoxin family protein [Magnetofaba australis]OSM06243.1 hypothetical protein MAIT1_01228 [Magnetofaba australis IT-1]